MGINISGALAAINPVGAIGTAASLGGSLIGAHQSSKDTKRTNEANLQLSREQMEFQRKESQIDRDFQREFAVGDREFQRDFAREDRDYQTMMSNTAYQRAMADMKQAGLNPMLAYQQGGAQGTAAHSVGSHSVSGTGKSGAGYAAQRNPEKSMILADATSKAINNALGMFQARNLQEQNHLLSEQTQYAGAQTEQANASAALTRNQLALDTAINNAILSDPKLMGAAASSKAGVVGTARHVEYGSGVVEQIRNWMNENLRSNANGPMNTLPKVWTNPKPKVHPLDRFQNWLRSKNQKGK